MAAPPPGLTRPARTPRARLGWAPCATRSSPSPPPSGPCSSPTSPTSTGRSSVSSTCPRRSRERCSRATRAIPDRCAAVHRGVRRRRPERGAAIRRRRGRAGGGTLRAHLRRLRRRLDRSGRRRARRLRVRLERAHEGPPAGQAGGLSRAVDPLYPLRPPARGRRWISLLHRRRPRTRLRRGDGRPVRDLLAEPRDRDRLGGRALAARVGAGARLARLDPRQGPRSAARAAAGVDAQPRRHLCLGTGLRGPAAAPRRLAAAGGPGVRGDDADRAAPGDPELRLPGRPSRPWRRVGRAPARAAAGDRARGGAARPRPPRRRSRSVGRARPRRRRRGGPALRLALRIGRRLGGRDPEPDRRARPDRAGGADRRARR